jgi:hypothetical protein
MPKRTKNYETGLLDRLKDPSYVMEYLKAALQNDERGEDAAFPLALRDAAKANMTYDMGAVNLEHEQDRRPRSH